MILVFFMVFTFDNALLFVILGVVLLLASCYLAFRQGQMAGHASCNVSRTIEHAQETGKINTIDQKMLKQAWSLSNGVKAIFAGALIGYVINVFYILCMMILKEGAVVLVARILSLIVTLPYWPIVAYWHESFTVITMDVVALLMICPFIIPLCQFAGYMGGPKLWAKTEKAMADGKRRAKARSRIIKKKAPKVKGPEI